MCALADRCQENRKETKVVKLDILCHLDRYFVNDIVLLLAVHILSCLLMALLLVASQTLNTQAAWIKQLFKAKTNALLLA